MFCHKCGFDNLPEATQCETCGEELISAEATAAGLSEEVSIDALSQEDVDILPEGVADNDSIEQDIKPIFVPVSPVTMANSASEGDVDRISNPVVSDFSGKKKSGNRLLLAAAVILAIILLVGLGVAFRYKILKLVNPERYLQVSLGRTFSDKVGSKVFDMSKYTDQAVEYAFSVETEDVDAEMSVLYSAKDEKALFELFLDDGTEVYDDILMYVSREVIAVKIPELLHDVEVLTINPETFEDDIKALGLEESLPKDYIENALDLFFGKYEDGEKDLDEVAEYYREAKFLEKYAEFSKGKTVTEKIDGETYRLSTMSYEIPEDAANDYLQDALDSYKQELIDGMGSMYQDYEFQDSQDALDEAFEIFKDIYIEGDIVITYFIDGNDYVRKITMDEVEIGMIGEEGVVSVEFEMLLSGKKYSGDKGSAILTLGVDGEEAELGINWEQSFKNGILEREFEFFVKGERGEDEASIVFEMEWDTKDKKGDNFEAVLTTEEDGFSIEISGALKDDKSETTFTNGQILLEDGYSDGIVIDFEFSISKIDPKDISMDLKDSVPFFDYVDELGGIEEMSL